MKNQWKLLVILTATFGLNSSIAQQPLDNNKTEFSLKEAYEYAVQNNANSKNATLDIKKGKHFVTEQISMGLPQINGEVAYNYNIEPPVFIFPDVAGPNPNPNNFVVISGAPLNTMNISATASMLLVSGQYFVGIQTAKAFLELTKQQKDKTDQDVKEQVIKAYYLVLIAQESKRVIDSTIQVMERTVYETEKIYEAGMIEELDVEQLKLVLFSTRDAAMQIKQSYDLAIYSLKYSMGYPFDQPIVLTEDLDNLIETGGYEETIASLPEDLDVNQTLDFKLISQKLKISEQQVKLQKAAAYPTLSTFLNVQGNFFNNERWLFLDGTTATLGGVIWGVNLQIPIFSSWGRVSKLKQLKIDVEKDRNTQYNVEQGLQVSYRNSKNGLVDSYNRYITMKKNYELAGKIKRVNGIKFKEGLISSLDLTQAESQFFDNQQKYYQAVFELLNAKIQVDKLLNQF